MPVRLYKTISGTVPRPRESSALQSPNESGDISKLWRMVATLSSRVESLTNQNRRFQEELNRLRLRKGGTDSTGNSCDEYG